VEEPVLALCEPGPCGDNAECIINDSGEDCRCNPGFSGNPFQVPNRSHCSFVDRRHFDADPAPTFLDANPDPYTNFKHAGKSEILCFRICQNDADHTES
jgi:hypothetical protein